MIKKVRVEDLQVGMFIADLNAPWVNHPFLTNHKTVRTPRDIDALAQHGIAEVYIDVSKGKDSSRAVADDEADAALSSRLQADLAEPEPGEGALEEKTPYEEELRKAKEIYDEARLVISRVLDAVRVGESVDGEATRATVIKMVDSVFRNRDALLTLARLKSYDEYTLYHCLNVAVLTLHLGASLGIRQGELLRLGIGSILHDVGKLRLPLELVEKGERLTPEEFEIVKTHAVQGASIILQCASVPNDSALAALNHHERYDGSGYPRGVSGLSVGKFGLIVAVVDVYDAMTSDRSYKRRLSPTQALKKIYEWAGSYFHPIYAQKFIQCLGIYPIGSSVVLDTGELGVVLRQNREQTLRPWIRLCRTPEGRSLIEPVDVDLRESDPSGQKSHARSVERVLRREAEDLDVSAILARKFNPMSAESATAVLSSTGGSPALMSARNASPDARS
jgi:putative nucleotidyltransferase with HDIG domain